MGFGLVLSPLLAAVSATAAEKDDFVPPTPQVVVQPVRLPWGEERASVTLKLVVDAQGYPQQVAVVGLVPTELRELVVAAVEQWRFSPATRHGAPVSAKVMLPLNVVAQ